MAPPEIIDVISSPEPDDSPDKAASTALAAFQPSKERRHNAALHVPTQTAFGNVGAVRAKAKHGMTQELYPVFRHSHNAQNVPVWTGLRSNEPYSSGGGAMSSPAQEQSLASLLEAESRNLQQQQQQRATSHLPSNDNHTVSATRTVSHIPSLGTGTIIQVHAQVPRQNAVTSVPSEHLSSRYVSPLKRPLTTFFHNYQTNKRQRLAESADRDRAIAPTSRCVSTQQRAGSLASADDVGLKKEVLTSDGSCDCDSVKAPFPMRPIEVEEALPTSNSAGLQHPSHAALDILPVVNTHGTPYSAEEDALLVRLKEDKELSWDEIAPYFIGRTRGSLQVRYSTKLAPRRRKHKSNRVMKRTYAPRETSSAGEESSSETRLPPTQPQKAGKIGGRRFISWQPQAKAFDTVTYRADKQWETAPAAATPALRMPSEDASGTDSFSSEPSSRPKRNRGTVTNYTRFFIPPEPMATNQAAETAARHGRNSATPAALPVERQSTQQDRMSIRSASNLLQQRELGRNARRVWAAPTTAVSDEFKEATLSVFSLTHYHHGTSGDVLSVSWSPDGSRFAAGSAAISDNVNMQYNMSRNLLLGDVERGELRELAEHHEPRPIVSDPRNINALHSMRESQDPRLFVTVTATGFSPDGAILYTTGKDRTLRASSVDGPLDRVRSSYKIDHAASVDLLSVGRHGLIATGCYAPTQSINVFQCGSRDFQHKIGFSQTEDDLNTSPRLCPSALEWGATPRYEDQLFAGFSGESKEEAGMTHNGMMCVWDVRAGVQTFKSASPEVFDAAWNPSTSSASVAFAVASPPSGISVDRGMRSVVQCYAPNQSAYRRVLMWECPALDINDVVFCPHDSNLIACGATDGKVYVWDQRFANRSQQPLHTLSHGESLTVLPHDRDRELIDTGVRFLSWGPTKSRLYSGSSDGIVKVWNPYRSADNTEVEEFTTPRHQRSAIMAGAFSDDAKDLLVGTEIGQLNIFSAGRRGHGRPAKRLEVQAPPSQEQSKGVSPSTDTRELLVSGKIEVRSCGALPVRQTVQGPNYDGPFAASAKNLEQAQAAWQSAFDNQQKLHASGVDSDEDDFAKARDRTRDAVLAIADCRDHLQFADLCRSRAQAYQRSLLAAELAQEQLQLTLPARVEPCTLDCGYFAAPAGDAADSGSSELRIPGFLKMIHQFVDMDLGTDDEVLHPGSARTLCRSCFPLLGGTEYKHVQCEPCALKQAGLNARCVKCSAPARPSTQEGHDTLCARCGFACFRCGRPARVSADAGNIKCEACDVEWSAGVLGYQLTTGAKGAALPGKARKRKPACEDDELEWGIFDSEASD